jgi:hypothetical protein
MTSHSFAIENWFSEITGGPEEEWEYGNGRWVTTSRHNGQGFWNEKTRMRYDAGTLCHHTLGKLRRLYAPSSSSMFQKVDPIIICQGTDIREVMVDPKHEGHMFQIQSQFNALQNDYDHDIDDDEFFTNDYSIPHQGTYASIMAPAAAIARRDHTTDPDESTYFSQASSGDHTNYLKQLGNIFDLHTGYVDNIVGRLPETADLRRELASKCSVVYQRDCKVYFDIRGNKGVWLETPLNIHQVFVSSMYYNDPKKEPHLKFLLAVAYEATYLAARACKAKALWLTLIGGNKRRNPLQLILNAINGVHARLGVEGMPVYLLDLDSRCVSHHGQVVVKG